MTNENRKLQELLEWAKQKNEHRNYLLSTGDYYESCGTLYPQEIIDKIQSLMPEPQKNDTEVGQWQVGDLLRFKACTNTPMFGFVGFCEHRGLVVETEVQGGYYSASPHIDAEVEKKKGDWTNIDAEFRAKDAEIKRLKNPWRTDLENTPRDGTRIDLIILCKGIAGASPERIADVMWNEKLNDWYIPDWEMTISDYNPNFGMQIKAWMPIPKFNGE